MKALIIDDEQGIRVALSYFLQKRGYEVHEAATGKAAVEVARVILPDLVFLDQKLPDMDGESLLPLLVSAEICACVIMITGHVAGDQAVRAMKQGAEYFFPKPIDMRHLTMILESVEARFQRKYEADYHRQLSENTGCHGEIVGISPHFLGVQRLISLLARNVSTPVLILGASGTGKELVAKSIHAKSKVSGPFVEINSASLSESLLESELFGHEKGAFTDAARCKQGLFELANNGTIFFDELAEMPLTVQAKLLKVLDTGIFRRVGGLEDLRSNARFIGATNRNIAELVKLGHFREDLYYRINVLPITLPPLRERGGDIVLLAEYYVEKLVREMGKPGVRASADFFEALRSYDWPGNVRELKNVIERAIIIADGLNMTVAHLPAELRRNSPGPVPIASSAGFPSLRDIEDDHIRRALQFTENNHSRTATLLGISRSTLHAKLKRLKL